MAQESTPPAAQPAASAETAVTVQGSEPAVNSVSRDKDTLSVDFPDEDIKTILRNVADLFELNLVVPDTLTGKTSIKLRDVTWRQIFQVVLGPVGYTYIEEGNIIKIVSNEHPEQRQGGGYQTHDRRLGGCCIRRQDCDRCAKQRIGDYRTPVPHGSYPGHYRSVGQGDRPGHDRVPIC
jgi:type II secretory pathway component GspD/PulD (secretin)